jgi:hypothetical protein
MNSEPIKISSRSAMMMSPATALLFRLMLCTISPKRLRFFCCFASGTVSLAFGILLIPHFSFSSYGLYTGL